MCKCLNEIEKTICEKSEDPNAYIVSLLDFKTGVSKPSMQYRFRKKKKNGEYGRENTVLLVPTFCPFCGIKYDEQE